MADARTSIHDVPDDLLEDILLRVSSPVCLTRAAAACKLWRRVIADPGFPGRFRSLNAPAIAGYYFNSCRSFSSMTKPWTSICPSFDPLSSTAARIDPRYFSLDFLSDVIIGLHDATLLDSRGSLLLIEFKGVQYIPDTFPDVLVVCEPLTRRYTKIPRPRDFDGNCIYWQSYLVDGDTDKTGGCISISNFRVLCEMYRGGIAHATVFTAGGSADSWSERAINHVVPKLDHTRRVLGHSGGSWYFYIIGGMTWIVLDGSTGEYSSFELPTTVDWDLHNYRWKYNFHVTDGCDGKPRIFSFLDSTVKVFARLSGNGEWALAKSIFLRYNEKWLVYLWTKGPRFIIVALKNTKVHTEERHFFSVDLETMEVKPAAEEKWNMLYRCTLPWPPTLHACLDR